MSSLGHFASWRVMSCFVPWRPGPVNGLTELSLHISPIFLLGGGFPLRLALTTRATGNLRSMFFFLVAPENFVLIAAAWPWGWCLSLFRGMENCFFWVRCSLSEPGLPPASLQSQCLRQLVLWRKITELLPERCSMDARQPEIIKSSLYYLIFYFCASLFLSVQWKGWDKVTVYNIFTTKDLITCSPLLPPWGPN